MKSAKSKKNKKKNKPKKQHCVFIFKKKQFYSTSTKINNLTLGGEKGTKIIFYYFKTNQSAASS